MRVKSGRLEAEMRKRLAAAGVDVAAPQARDLPIAWDVVVDLSRVRLSDRKLDREPSGDMLLAQFGTYDWGQGPLFRVSLDRQFSIDHGDYSDTRQMQCEFRFAPTPELDALGAASLYTMQVDYDLAEFERRFRSWPAFSIQLEPAELFLSLEQVG
jgi:hypothetical protein